MEHLVYYDIAAAFVLLTALVAYHLRKYSDNFQSRVYRVMLYALLVVSTSDFLLFWKEITFGKTGTNGKTWEGLDVFDNYSGGFDWTTYTYPIGEYLSNNLFKIRFRAHGDDAKWINYWYVDDVKVWNPVWAKVQRRNGARL